MTLRLFVEHPLAEGAAFALPPGAARHAQVRRVQPGDALVLFDGAGADWPAEVTAMGRHDVQVRVGAPQAVDRELPWPVTLAVGMPANERMDWLVEMATELGVARLQPLVCERSVLRLAGERAVWPLARWLADGAPAGRRLVLAPGAAPLGPPRLDGPLCALSGPEGGLAPAEEEAARAAGFEPVGLGARILRAETAPLALLAWAGFGA